MTYIYNLEIPLNLKNSYLALFNLGLMRSNELVFSRNQKCTIKCILFKEKKNFLILKTKTAETNKNFNAQNV
jgi:hypothetical protein